MTGKNENSSKIILTYEEHLHNKIKDLDTEKEHLIKILNEETNSYKELTAIREKLQEDNKLADNDLNSLVRIIKARGIIFDIPYKNIEIKEWDNLYLEKENNVFYFVSKSNVRFYILDKEYNDAIEFIIKNYSYSIVIIRKDPVFFKAQLRILK